MRESRAVGRVDPVSLAVGSGWGLCRMQSRCVVWACVLTMLHHEGVESGVTKSTTLWGPARRWIIRTPEGLIHEGDSMAARALGAPRHFLDHVTSKSWKPRALGARYPGFRGYVIQEVGGGARRARAGPLSGIPKS